MENFIFRNPTKLIFGKGMIARLAEEIPAGVKIMVTFGGGSVKRNGVYEQVVAALAGRDYIEFWGIEPNPKIETLRKAVEQCKREGVGFLLAVGGGSVLDGTKLIAAAVHYDGDAWDLVRNGSLIGEIVPFGDVMTLPATASEMNRNAVISSTATREKYGMKVDYPRFSILDPQTTFSLPAYQRAAGMADTFIHVMEQYMTVAGQSPLMDRWSEGILQTLVEIAPRVLAEPHDYDTMADYMLCATMGLNGFIAMGVAEDWATHQIGPPSRGLPTVIRSPSFSPVCSRCCAGRRCRRYSSTANVSGELRRATTRSVPCGPSTLPKRFSGRWGSRPGCTRWESARRRSWRSSVVSTRGAWPSAKGVT